MDTEKCKSIARQRRLDILDLDYRAQTGHIGGAMSCIDLLVCLYYGIMEVPKIRAGAPDRDRFVLSKGHCAEALYTVLCDLGFFLREELETYARFGSRLAEHPTAKVPGVEFSTGALGHGVCVAVGMALGLKKQGKAHVYVLMGDGEQAEGSVWEACMAASKYKLDNLTLIVDRNHLQITGDTESVMPLGSLAEKYRAFGFHVEECDGHDFEAAGRALKARRENQPTVVIAETVKGKGCSFMENIAEWHHRVPDAEQYQKAKSEILGEAGAR